MPDLRFSASMLLPSVSLLLDAFFRLPEDQKEFVRQQVQRANDPALSEAEREKAAEALGKSLKLRASNQSSGRKISREERLTQAHLALRERLDKEEAIFGANLARLMGERQLTQAQLAERVGVGQSAISMMLKRRCRPRLKTIGKLAVALGVDVDALWPGFREPWQQIS